jgi:DNA modification methylase
MPQVRQPSTETELKPYWQTNDDGQTCRLYLGDVEEVLTRLPSRSVHTCITSPPYWGMRSYATNGSSQEIGAESCLDCLTWGKANCRRCYVCRLVQVFRKVRRVLRTDGTLWLNLGDKYGNEGCGGDSAAGKRRGSSSAKTRLASMEFDIGGLGSTNLLGLPWRVAMALQSDGWILRQDIVWYKPAPLPESIMDRCVRAHEYLFLLAPRSTYWFDHVGIREQGSTLLSAKRLHNPETNKTYESGRQRHSVWKVAQVHYPGAHCATFPVKLITPPILASTSSYGCCATCGKPYTRIDGDKWSKACSCVTTKVVPATVLDPFIGSGTTASVALELGRRAIGIDLSSAYIQQNAVPRIEGALVSIPKLRPLLPVR